MSGVSYYNSLKEPGTIVPCANNISHNGAGVEPNSNLYESFSRVFRINLNGVGRSYSIHSKGSDSPYMIFWLIFDYFYEKTFKESTC